ncbi:hypothetical protein GGF31_001030 [Allomyces arbusculus]|nr:hypothetical protein GGF31_001030 [Allomyces arbusculus]
MALHAIPPTHTAQSNTFEHRVKVLTPAVKSFTILPPFGPTIGAVCPPAVPTRQPAADSQDAARGGDGVHDRDTWVPAVQVVVKNVATTASGVTAVYARQLVNGLDRSDQIGAAGDSFYRGARTSQPAWPRSRTRGSTTGTPPADAFKALALFVGAPTPTTVNVTVPAPTGDASAAPLFEITSEIATAPVSVHYQYVQNGNNLKLAYSLQLKQTRHWYHGHVNVQTSEVEAVNDWAAAARYPVIPAVQECPDSGPIVIVDSASAILTNASSLSWHATSVSKFTMSKGNNVISKPNTNDAANNVFPDGGADLDFTKYAPVFATANPTTTRRPSNNFQKDNFSKRGMGTDAIAAMAQDAEASSTDALITPSNGTPPLAFLSLFTLTTPKHDGDFGLVVLHYEFSYSVSSRLTGGFANPNCLSDF